MYVLMTSPPHGDDRKGGVSDEDEDEDEDGSVAWC